MFTTLNLKPVVKLAVTATFTILSTLNLPIILITINYADITELSLPVSHNGFALSLVLLEFS